jgi:CRP/FNR family cyclic AMP-dependent transcriptional regulator
MSDSGKEAIVALPSAGDFIGEEALAGANRKRITSAVAVTACSVVAVDRQEMVRMVRAEQELTQAFIKFLVSRTISMQADYVSHMFNCSEKRLARLLLSMAELEKTGEAQQIIPKITQKQLAEMVGTTRSRISFFMNRFRKMGFIEYDDRIQVNQSLLNVAPYDTSHGMPT